MKQIITIVVLSLVIVVFSCHQAKEVSKPYTPAFAKQVDSDYLQHLFDLIKYTEIHRLEMDPNRLYESIEFPLKSVQDESVLRDYFYSIENAKPQLAQKAIDVSILAKAQEAILFQLAKLNTNLAAQTLVAIYADSKLTFDASLTLTMGEALVMSGQKIIPYLKPQLHVRPQISKRVLECLATGRSFL